MTNTAARRLADDDAEPPTSRCYWVMPGMLLAGAYPGHKTRAKHRLASQAFGPLEFGRS